MDLTCQECGKVHKRVRLVKEFDMKLCETCYKTYKYNPVKYIPPIGEIHYDDEGKLICHICGRSYHKLSEHIRGKHNIKADIYKEKFELNRTFKLTSEYLKEKFKNNPTVDISSCRKPFKKGHTINKGKTKRLQARKNRLKIIEPIRIIDIIK